MMLLANGSASGSSISQFLYCCAKSLHIVALFCCHWDWSIAGSLEENKMTMAMASTAIAIMSIMVESIASWIPFMLINSSKMYKSVVVY
jgi:hypothetical protein